MDLIEAIAKEKEEATKAAKDSGLSTRAFAVFWKLKSDGALGKAGIPAMELAKEAETQLARFPNARVNEDEQRRLRAALYRPLLRSGQDRTRTARRCHPGDFAERWCRCGRVMIGEKYLGNGSRTGRLV